MVDDLGEARRIATPKPHQLDVHRHTQEDTSSLRHIKFVKPQDSPLQSEYSDYSTIPCTWPKFEPYVLVESKENPAAPAVIKKIPVSELRTWTFYGDEPNE